MSISDGDHRNVYSRNIRASRADAGTCVNGRALRTHGCRCTRCYLVHRHGVMKARLMPEYQQAPLCNPEKPSPVRKRS